jgi:hypothetical protein
MLVAAVGQASAGATLQIEYSDEMFAVLLVVRRNSEKIPIGGEVWIFVTDLGELTQFLATLVVPHEPRRRILRSLHRWARAGWARRSGHQEHCRTNYSPVLVLLRFTCQDCWSAVRYLSVISTAAFRAIFPAANTASSRVTG